MRSYLASLLILLVSVPAYAWNPMTVTSNAGTAAVAYDLNITFDVSNDTCADTETIGAGTPSCGTAHGTGSLTVVDTSTGTVAIGGNDLDVTGSNAWSATGITSTTATTRAIGKTFKWVHTNPAGTVYMNLQLDADSSIDNATNNEDAFLMSNAGLRVHDGTSQITLFTEVEITNTTAEYAIILGGYDEATNTIPYKSGDTASLYDDGVSYFYKQPAGNWELMWKNKTHSTATVYPQFNLYSNSANVLDSLAIPTSTLESLLQPNSLALFTGTNGDNLVSAYTMDVDPAASGWTSRACLQNEVWDIDTNAGEFETASDGSSCADNDTDSYLYVDTSDDDLIIDANVTCVATASNEMGLMFRGKADTANGMNAWTFQFRGDGAACDWHLTKYVDGSQTDVASDASHDAAAGEFAMRCITDDTAIDCFIAGTAEANPAAQSDLKDETWAGVFANAVNDKIFDEFAVFPRGTGGEYVTLDSY